MTSWTDQDGQEVSPQDAFSLLGLGSVFLRRRRVIQVMAFCGLVIGLLAGLLPARQYRSTAVFQPQFGETRVNSLALMASSFGLDAAGTRGEWSAPVYVELLRMRSLLEPIARDTVIVAERAGRAMALMDLLDVDASSYRHRVDRTVGSMRQVVRSREIGHIGAVEVSATTRWPSVSLWLVQRLVHGVDRFNVETRRSQAAEERSFVAMQVKEARSSLQHAEERLLEFLQTNRVIVGSPELTFEHDRLQREVAQLQQIHTSLVQSLEDARIREVRDTPVITMLETPRLAVEPESRRLALKAVLGLIAGALLGMIGAALAHAWIQASRQDDGAAREFLDLVRDAMPRFGSKGGR